jgi:hypothetical protein
MSAQQTAAYSLPIPGACDLLFGPVLVYRRRVLDDSWWSSPGRTEKSTMSRMKHGELSFSLSKSHTGIGTIPHRWEGDDRHQEFKQFIGFLRSTTTPLPSRRNSIRLR